jgi:hypothetical protein
LELLDLGFSCLLLVAAKGSIVMDPWVFNLFTAAACHWLIELLSFSIESNYQINCCPRYLSGFSHQHNLDVSQLVQKFSPNKLFAWTGKKKQESK